VWGEVDVHGAQVSGGGAVHFDPIRRVVLAGTVTFLALAGHAVGRGELPGFIGLAVVLVLASALTFAACSKRRSAVWLLGYLLATQLLIHVLLVLASPHAHATGSQPLIPTGDMAASHLVAALVAAVVLARGEDTLEAWARLLSAGLTWLLPTLAPLSTSPAQGIESAPWARVTSDLTAAHRRRGPPRNSFA
jgi:hypothetical protein